MSATGKRRDYRESGALLQRKIQRYGAVARQDGAAFRRLSDRAKDDPQRRASWNPEYVSLGTAPTRDLQLDPEGGRGAEGEIFRTRGFPSRSL